MTDETVVLSVLFLLDTLGIYDSEDSEDLQIDAWIHLGGMQALLI